MVKEGLLNSQAFPICHGHGQSRILKPGTSFTGRWRLWLLKVWMDCIDIFHRKMEALTAESLNGLHGYGGEFERVCESHQHLLSWFGTLYLLSQLPGWLSGKELTGQCRRCQRCGFDPCVRKIPRRRKWQPTPVFLPGTFHGQRSLAGYSLWGHKELDMAENMHTGAIIHSSTDNSRDLWVILWQLSECVCFQTNFVV